MNQETSNQFQQSLEHLLLKNHRTEAPLIGPVETKRTMKEVATVTVPQDPDETQLTAQIYSGKAKFYIRFKSSPPVIPKSMPMRLYVSDLNDAKSQADLLFYLIIGTSRRAVGKSPDLPEHLKQIESELPAYFEYVLAKNFEQN